MNNYYANLQSGDRKKLLQGWIDENVDEIESILEDNTDYLDEGIPEDKTIEQMKDKQILELQNRISQLENKQDDAQNKYDDYFKWFETTIKNNDNKTITIKGKKNKYNSLVDECILYLN